MEISRAIEIAKERLSLYSEESGCEMQLYDEFTIEGKSGWAFFYNSSKYIKYGHLSDALVGNGPILVFHDGRVEEVSSSLPVDDVRVLIGAI